MGRHLYLDCFAGVSGDMLLGALCDLEPARFGQLREKMLPLAGGGDCDLVSTRVRRAGVSASKITVDVTRLRDMHRNLGEVMELLSRAQQLSPAVRQRGEAAFRHLFDAEAAIHGQDLRSVHLHEAGAVDALIDVLGSFFLIEALDVDRVTCSPLNVGHGTATCSHGTYPVPAPATAELLRGVPVYQAGPPLERVTPTGAAIIRALRPEFTGFPAFVYDRVGYGAGDNDSAGYPNVLRVFLGEDADGRSGARAEEVEVIEATIDDMNGQVAGYLFERALAIGAIEVYFTPIYMKKNRPAVKLTCLSDAEHIQALSRLLFEETTSLGLRFSRMNRLTLDRESETVQTPWGDVRMKIGRLEGRIVNYHPEYEDCAALAREARVPLKKVQAEAVASFLRTHPNEQR
ncbi:MAG: nickel pincer cofactor biosynthesis protein LarC [Acidobacteriota bacterium]